MCSYSFSGRFVLYGIFSLSLICGTPAWTAADEPGKPLVEQVAAISKENRELEQWFYAGLRAANRDRERISRANQDHSETVQKLAARLAPLIKENAPRPEAFDAVLVKVGEVRYPLDREETRIVLEHHLGSPKMGTLCFHLRSRGDEAWAKQILTGAAEKHPDRSVRGQATFALADALRSAAMVTYREVPDEQRKSLLAEAAKHYQTALDQYAATPTPDGKTMLGEKARHELARIKNLPSLVVGGTAPPIEGEDLDGKRLTLADYRGKVVLLVFWGSWCGPCMAMVPHERELFERHREKPFVMLGVNCGDARDKAQATVKDKQMAWRHWWDGEEIRGFIETDYNVPHWPRIFVIDKAGLIRGIDPEGEQLDELIEKVLAEG